MRAGKLRHRVRIERPVRTVAASGAVAPGTWSLVRDVWASIEPLSGRELIEAGRMSSEVTHRITTRYDQDIVEMDSTYRMVFRSRVFSPVSMVVPDERNESIVISARESN